MVKIHCILAHFGACILLYKIFTRLIVFFLPAWSATGSSKVVVAGIDFTHSSGLDVLLLE
jgi:hypothetical protein